MLKPGETTRTTASLGAERPLGELVHQLVEDGKAFARAELNVVKATASAKAGALTVPVILFATAFLLLQAAVTVLAVATFLALLPLVGPFFAGVLAFLIFAGLAGGLALFAVKKLKSDL